MLSTEHILDDTDFEISFRSRSNSRASNLSSSYYSAYAHARDNADIPRSPTTPLPNGLTNHVTETIQSESLPPSSPLTSREIFTLISLCLTSCCSAMFYSLLAPFFPTEAQKKGASSFEVGMIMGAFQLIIFITAPVYGHFLTHIGPKFMYVTGILSTSICAILFGTLEWCPDGTIYVVMCFVVRGVEALSAAAVSTSNLAIAGYTFPVRLATVMGILEACSSIGLMVGPPLGGALFSAGGFGLPFYVSGGAYFLCGIMSAFILPSLKAQKRQTSGKSRCSLLKIPIILLVGYMVWIGAACIGFTDVGLAGHIAQFNLSPVIVGLLFLIPSGSVIIFAPINGWLTDKNRKFGRAILIFGGVIGTAGFVCLGPSPIATFLVPENELWVVCASLAVCGIGLSSLVVTYQEYVAGARKHGFPDTHGDTGSGVWGL